MSTDRNNGPNTERAPDGRFGAGNPGKPRGTKHRATRLATQLFEDGIEDVVSVVLEAAKGGDLTAARIVLDKLIPSVKERAVELPDLPDTSTAQGIAEAQRCVLGAVSNGSLTPSEANTVSNIIEARRRALETQDLEVRLAALENKK